MIPERYTTRRIRSRYLRALREIPLPIRPTRVPDPALTIDLVGLPVLTVETIDDREVRYSLVLGQPRFRLTFAETRPNLIGHVIALGTPGPRLIISEPLHTEWALANEQPLTEGAARIWNEHARECER